MESQTNSTTSTTAKKGQIKVDTQDIFPIIKRWLYSEHDIFLRELVANATDAITKRHTVGRIDNLDAPEGQIFVDVDPSTKTLSIIDNGIGMTAEEVEKYITQLAFSGAAEFVNKMKDMGNDASKDIIGKFGLGFYSAFMVADVVEINTLSMTPGSTPVYWRCEGQTDYSMDTGSRTTPGTTITLHLNKESEEFSQAHKVSTTLRQYCDFMPYPIVLEDVEARAKRHEELKKAENETDETKKQEMIDRNQSPLAINNTTPLWKKDPKELKDEDYKDFFRKLFPMEQEPLFWVHLRVDHPFTLEGILYFPKFNKNRPFQENNIRLYCKQVFVSDNVKNIIPDFLGLLRGAIDSSDIPLNVSRSSLQGDPNIKKISNYVVKKVGEALKKLSMNEREQFETIWPDIGLFVKYGMVSDSKFDEMMRPYALMNTADHKLMTLEEYKNSIPENYKEKMDKTVLYFEKGKSDVSLVNQLKDLGINAFETDEIIDPHFMQHVESHKVGEHEFQFKSVDSQIENLLSNDNDIPTEEQNKLKQFFANQFNIQLPKEKTDSEENTEENTPAANNRFELEVKNLGTATPAYFKIDEQMKRFQQMAKSMGNAGMMFPMKKTLVINPTHPLVQNAFKLFEKGNHPELVDQLCNHIEDLARISSETLEEESKNEFIQRTQKLVQDLSQLALH